MLLKHFTGLDEEKFNELCRRVSEIPQCKPAKRGGLKQKLSLREQVAATLILLRHNVTEELVAEIFDVIQSVMSKIKDRIEPLLDEATAFSDVGFRKVIAIRQAIVDGSYVPTFKRKATGKTNYSGKRRCQCLNAQIACDQDGTLLSASTPVAGSCHDLAALELCGRKELLAGSQWVADTGYVGTNALTPIKKQKGRKRLDSERTTKRSTVQSPESGAQLNTASRTGRTGKSSRTATADNSKTPHNHPTHHTTRTLPTRLMTELGMSL